MQQLSTTILPILFLATLSGLTTLIGTILAISVGRHTKGIAFGIGFSAVIMLLISFTELIPEAIGEAGIYVTVLFAALGATLIALLHWIVPHTHLIKENGAFNFPLIRSAYLVMFGLILHDIPEGFAMANAYIASSSLGLFVAIVIAMHNIPEEFAIAAPIVSIRKPRLLYIAAFISALAEPIGAIIGLFAVYIHPAFNGVFLALAGGAMIFVAIHELLPMMKIYRETEAFIGGGIFSAVLYLILSRVLAL